MMIRFIVAIAMLLTGCSSLTPPENESLAAVKALCERVDVNGYGVKLNLGPKGSGETPPKPVLELRPGATGESLLYQTYWNQNLCTLGHIIDGFPTNRIEKWIAETGQAFDAWRPLDAQKFDIDRAALVSARDAHLARLEAEGRSYAAKAGPVRLELFRKAFPKHDFFNVVEFDAGIDLGPGTKFKNVDISKLDPGVKIEPSQFSSAIRPALSSTYQAVGFYAMSKITDMEMVRLAVASVYQAGITRIDDAKLAKRSAPATDKRP